VLDTGPGASYALWHASPVLIHYERYWSEGFFVGPMGERLATFNAISAPGQANQPVDTLWQISVAGPDQHTILSVFEEHAHPLHHDSVLTEANRSLRLHHSYRIEDGERQHVGLIWSRYAVLSNRWTLHLQTTTATYTLRARSRHADWNTDHSWRELTLDLDDNETGTATVTPRWTDERSPTDNILITASDELSPDLRALIVAVPLCLPMMGLTGKGLYRGGLVTGP
jgi:hypothetical protein